MEKYDGIRVFWNGKELKTSSGQAIKVPETVIGFFPKDIYFEGELWCGYKSLQKAMDIVSGRVANWNDVQVVAFDVPLMTTNSYTDRLDLLKKSISQNAILKVVSPVNCAGKEHVNSFMNEVFQRGGEGIVLRVPSAYYFERNSFLVQKVF